MRCPVRARRALLLAGAIALLLMGASTEAQDRAIPLDRLRSGATFMSAEARAQQADDFSNPAMLWVERGAKLWGQQTGTAGRSCADCHQDAKVSMKGVATRYPAIDKTSGRLFNLPDRILDCRANRQGAPRPAWESEEMLSLTAFVGHQSRGEPMAANIEGAARPHFNAGRDLYYRRVGQLNLSCAHCHESLWGRTLYAEKISQGHPNAFPIYRLEWQATGSLERRLRACYSGIRAEMFQYGAPEHRDLELFLAWRAQGLPIETPGVRR